MATAWILGGQARRQGGQLDYCLVFQVREDAGLVMERREQIQRFSEKIQ